MSQPFSPPQGPAPPQAPPSPEAVGYRPATNPQQACAQCAQAQAGPTPQLQCSLLQQMVDPTATCDAFAPKQDVMSQLFGGAPGGQAPQP